MLKWTLQNPKSHHHPHPHHHHNLETKTVKQEQIRRRRRRHSIGIDRSSIPLTTTTAANRTGYSKTKLKQKIPLRTAATTTTTETTMTATLERHFRRSSFGSSDSNFHRTTRQQQQHQIDSNKENLGIYFVRSPTGNTSLTALHDLSNGKSPSRLATPAAAPMRRRTIAAQLNIKRFNGGGELESTATTTTTQCDDAEAAAAADADGTESLNQIKFRSQANRDESLSSSRMGDATLDRMLDAIIESAARDDGIKCQHAAGKQPPQATTLPPSDCEFEDSIHEMEVCTPTHLKRQRVVRRKNNHRPTENDSMREKSRKPEMIGLTLPNGIPSPETPENKRTTTTTTAAAATSASYNYIAAVETPQNYVLIVDSSCSLAANFPKDAKMQRCSTPTTMEQAQSIKRCLSFSPNHTDDEEFNDAKRSSVASSNVSSEGATSPGRSASRSLTMPVKGSLDLAIFIDSGTRLNVHVIRCRDLQRSNGSTSLNAYVKVNLIRCLPAAGAAAAAADTNAIENSCFQRTAVHRHSSRPYFDHRFIFDLQRKDARVQVNSFEFSADERVQLAVWHRDRQFKRSEFLGCMSFPLRIVAQKPVHGSYKLQPQSCLNNPIAAVPASTLNPNHVARQPTPTPTHDDNDDDDEVELNAMMATTLRQQKSEEDVISIDSMTAASMNLIDAQTNQPVALSKKALHQRDADENLFLRFLELDPPAGGGGGQANHQTTTNTKSFPPPASGGGGGGGGRTPFTVTKKLTRTADRGFGFSIVWTHPPRVEKVEPGFSADRSGIQPGDYVIFVDKHNVVTMPESDVLNLIRSQGNTLTMEIFRRSHTGSVATSIGRSSAANVMNGGRIGSAAAQKTSRLASVSSNYTVSEMSPAPKFQPMPSNLRPPTSCSAVSSIEAAKKRLNLPQVTFSKESISPITDNRRRFLLQLISREQNFISALLFGTQRFVQPLLTRKDLISPNDHRTLFQNIDELLRLSEDILEQLCHDSQEPQMNFTSRVYLSKTTAICAAYKKYCNGIKRADCVLVNKSRQAGSEFVAFITEPQVPRKCPDLTMFIHRPLQHFREILKLMQLLASNCHVDSEEHRNFTSVINELQAAYREITVSSGLMEPLGEGRPLLTLQDLESRMVFTKCKPFTLAVQGRQWIFGGDLSRVEGRSVKPYWTLLFSDIIVFAKVSRDRVLFITEEPVPIANIVDSCFHMRKKTTEFRLTVDPNGRLAESPTGYCAPDLTRTPKKSARRKSLILRAPSLELKAVWQNLLQRQIFLVNAALGSTPLSSPLDSPDVLNTLVPLSDIGMTSASYGSVKLSSLDSINLKNQQYQQQQQQQQQNRHHLTNPTQQIEKLIDEKCRILNKTGTPRSSALHLANWMKGQLDKQQEQARLAAARSRDNISREDEHLLYPEGPDYEERITYWTRSQLEKRTKELNLIKKSETSANHAEKRGSREEMIANDCQSEVRSQSRSRSTTGSQITVRSSPVAHKSDKLAVCRHCHKNCQQQQQQQDHQELRSSSTSPPPLLCNSLKVQHNQSSPHRCCKLNGNDHCPPAANGSLSSITSSTVTGDHRSCSGERSSCHKRKTHSKEHKSHQQQQQQIIRHNHKTTTNTKTTAETTTTTTTTDSDHEQILLITDDSLSQSDTSHHDDSSSSIRILDLIIKSTIDGKGTAAATLLNGHCSKEIDEFDDENDVEEDGDGDGDDILKRRMQIPDAPTPSRRRMNIAERNKTVEPPQPNLSNFKNQITASSAFRQCNCKCDPQDFQHSTISADKLHQETCKMFETIAPQRSPTLSRHLVDKVEVATRLHSSDLHKNCKCVCGDRVNGKTTAPTPPSRRRSDYNDDEDLSMLLIGLAQLTPAVNYFNMNPVPVGGGVARTAAPSTCQLNATRAEETFVPTISIVPPTPDAILSKTSTNIWDNTATAGVTTAETTTTTTTTTATTQLLITNTPRQAIIENIPDDSADESAAEDDPPYHPMGNTLRRYGTLSSLEKLPSEDRVEGGAETSTEMSKFTRGDSNGDDFDENARADSLKNENGDDVDDDGDDHDDDDGDDDDGMENTIGDDDDDDIEVITKEIFDHEMMPHSSSSYNIHHGGGGAHLMNSGVGVVASKQWASRAGSFVAGKMSFFEESRAFIDKYLGRWNQENADSQQMMDDEQIDECTSGATSGEEMWGTPTSGGDNDDMHLATSENTHSSPTKSSTSLNDDDDTELMMDELLMAPPMTASSIRGLLPRRRLEPLFEEETESDEEKTQQQSEDLKKGEMTTNGHDLEDSTGSSSDEEEEEEGEEEQSTEGEPPDLQPKLGPRPLRAEPQPGPPQPAAQLLPSSTMSAGSAMIPLPPTMKGSCCEYLLEQRSVVATATMATSPDTSEEAVQLASVTSSQMTMEMTATSATMTMATTTANNGRSLISTTISNVNVTTNSNSTTNLSTTIVRKAKFIPPPPPPRRLLLMPTVPVQHQRNVAAAGDGDRVPIQPTLGRARKSGAFSADTGFSVDVAGVGATTATTSSTTTNCAPQTAAATTTTTTRPKDAPNTRSCAANIAPVASQRPTSATIIETSLLGRAVTASSSSMGPGQASILSTTLSTAATMQPKCQELLEQQPPKQTDSAGSSSTNDSPVTAKHGSGLSPRLEMRLALNHDILGDEDLISYDPGPDLTTILGHDLSTFQRLTGRDLLNRSATNRVQPKEAVISFCQQRNSKMDTPTVNRRPRPNQQQQQQQQPLAGVGLVSGGNRQTVGDSALLQPNRNTWSNYAFAADQSNDAGSATNDASCKNNSYSSDSESKLSDLEILARREMIYCMSQSKSGLPAKTATTTTLLRQKMGSNLHLMRTMSISSMGTTETEMGAGGRSTPPTGNANKRNRRKIGRDDATTALMETGKGNRLINFLRRRNSEMPLSENCSNTSLTESNASSTTLDRRQLQQLSPRKDNDKPSLNRRLWKQITKRRRANSVSEIAAS